MKRFLPILLAAVVLGTSGCHLFSKKKKSPAQKKQDPNVALQVENDFMHRWMDKRVAELTSQGLSADAARKQATSEFKERFGYTDAARKIP